MRLFGNMNNETIKAKINKCIQEEKLFENLKSRFCSTSRTICQSLALKHYKLLYSYHKELTFDKRQNLFTYVPIIFCFFSQSHYTDCSENIS